MDVYLYQADLHCEECGEMIRASLKADRFLEGFPPSDFDNESSYDSDVFPKGPYADGGGEADSPQHCGTCRVFLENPLTRDGEVYLLSAVLENLREGREDSVALTVWAPYYWDGFDPLTDACFDRFDMCDALCVLSHDYGLYALRTRLDDVGYRPGLAGRGSFENLSDNGKSLYLRYALRLRGKPDDAYEPRPWQDPPAVRQAQALLNVRERFIGEGNI